MSAVSSSATSDGPNIVALAMNGWDEGHPSWWLNLEAHPDAVVRLARQHPRPVYAHTNLHENGESLRPWQRWVAVDPNLDAYAGRRSQRHPIVPNLATDRLMEPGEGGFRVPQLKRKSRRTSQNTYSTHSGE